MKVGGHHISWWYICALAAPTLFAGAAFSFFAFKSPQLVLQYAAIFSTLAILISGLSAALAGLIFASVNIQAQTRNAKVKAAYDAVAKKQWDKDHIAARATFLDLLRKKADLSQYVVPDDHEFSEAKSYCEALRNICNDHELTAIAIEEHVIDENFLKKWSRSSLMDDFEKLKPYIQAVRDKIGNKAIFVNFENLARRWGK